MLIGEVAARTGISARMLRHYDAVGLVSPSGRTSGGYRRYRDEDLRRLFHAEALRALGLTLQQAAAALDDPSFSVAEVIEAITTRTRERVARDQELLRRLRQVQDSEPTAWSDVVHTIGLVHGLGAPTPSARQRAAMALSVRHDGDAVLLAEAALDEADPHVAGALHWALARSGDGGLPVLARALESASPEQRRRAVAALTELASPGAIAVLTTAMTHPDAVVSGRAALVCGAHGDLAAVPRLVALVVDGRDDVEAGEVLGALAARHDRAAPIAEALATALGDADGQARRRLTGALAEVPGPEAHAALVRLTGDPDHAVAITARAVLRHRASHPGSAGTGADPAGGR